MFNGYTLRISGEFYTGRQGCIKTITIPLIKTASFSHVRRFERGAFLFCPVRGYGNCGSAKTSPRRKGDPGVTQTVNQNGSMRACRRKTRRISNPAQGSISPPPADPGDGGLRAPRTDENDRGPLLRQRRFFWRRKRFFPTRQTIRRIVRKKNS